MMEGGEDVEASLMADGEAPEPREPCQAPLDFPAVAAKPLARLEATARNPGADGAAAQGTPAAGGRCRR